MYYFLELFLILTIFVLPPIFTTESPTLGFVEFNLFHFLIYGFLGIYCFIRSKNFSEDYKTSENQHKYRWSRDVSLKPLTHLCFGSSNIVEPKSNFLKIIVFSLITLILLFGNGFLWQWIAKSPSTKLDYSKSIFVHLFQIVGMGLYAFYEETMYRNYLQGLISKFLENMVKSPIKEKFRFFVAEILSLLLFAFGHLYMGIFAVLNALIAGIILRFLVIKTKSIFPSSIVHFIYNLTLYSLMVI